jgi:hypothetical protein
MSDLNDALRDVRTAWRQCLHTLDEHLHVRALILRIIRWLP